MLFNILMILSECFYSSVPMPKLMVSADTDSYIKTLSVSLVIVNVWKSLISL